MRIIVLALTGFWFVIGVLLIVYSLWGAYDSLFLSLNDEGLGGSVMILIVAGLLTGSSYISIRCVKYFPTDWS